MITQTKLKADISCAAEINDFQVKRLAGNSKGRERGGLVFNVSDFGSRGRGFEPHSGQTVLCP